MKKMMIMCGSGVATSTLVMSKVTTWLKEKGYNDVRLFQSKVAEEVNRIDDYDVVVSTTVVPEKIKNKVISGVPLLTGLGTEAMFDEIDKKLKE